MAEPAGTTAGVAAPSLPAVTLFFVAATLLSFARILFHFQTRVVVPVDLFDAAIHIWLRWWNQFGFYHRLNLYHTRWMFFPAGLNISHVVSITNLLFVDAPFGRFLTPVGLYNAGILLSYALTGASAFCLCRLLVQDAAGAFIGAVFLTFSPARNLYALIGGFDMLQTQWPLFVICAAVALLRSAKLTAGTILAVAGASLCSMLHDARMFMGAVFFVTLYAVFSVAGETLERKGGTRRFVTRYAVFALVVGLVAIPLFLYHSRRGFSFNWIPRYPDIFTVECRELFEWPPHHVLRRTIGAFDPPTWEGFVGYLNPLAIVLAGFGMRRRLEHFSPFVFTALLALFIFFSFFYWPVSAVPVLNFLRIPVRFFFFALIVLSVFVAAGWREASRFLPAGARRGAGALLVFVFIAETNPVWFAPREIPRYSSLTAVRADPELGSVLDLPFGVVMGRWTGRFETDALLRGVQHGKPLLNGYTELEDGPAWKIAMGDPAIRELLDCQKGGRCAGIDENLFSGLQSRFGVRYILVDMTKPTPLSRAVADSDRVEQIAAEPDLKVYRLKKS